MEVANLSSNDPELDYTRTSDLAHRKRLGQFFTPYSVARFMSQWIAGIGASHPQVLDPCAGLGVFERAFSDSNQDIAGKCTFTLWEKDERLAAELADICQTLPIRHSIVSKDFLNEHDWSATYDAIIANPPYYKHHFVENKQDMRNAMSAQLGSAFSVQTNIYCWFLIKALALLKDGGRLAFIIPTEFLNANYGREVKEFLLRTECLRHVISVGYKSRTFDDAITTACVLLAEKGIESPGRIRFHQVESSAELDDLETFLGRSNVVEYRSSELDPKRKWRSCFPGGRRIRHKTSNLVPFSTYGRFSRGIATGANAFFTIRPSRALQLDLPADCLIPCLGKTRQAPDKTFVSRDYEDLKMADQPVLLFDGQAADGDAVKRYISIGEESGYHQRYLTRVRTPWYALEQRRPGPIWVGVFSRGGVRFIWNESDCVSLTCFHGFLPGETGRKFLPLLFLYLNSGVGRNLLELEQREYGDGLAKFEPNDINGALAPDFRLLERPEIDRLAELQELFKTCEKKSAQETAILGETDSILAALLR